MSTFALRSPLPLRPIRALLAVAAFVSLTAAACGGADAAARGGSATTETPPTEFDGNVALEYVRQQVAFGPRVPGTAAHRAAGDWLVAELTKRADTVLVQEWTHTTADGKKLPMRNILARFKPAEARRALYLAHWDSRPFADKESDPAKAKLAVPGANDGGSGVAILLGVADALKKQAPNTGVDLLFVDGEDWGSFESNTDVLIGSRYFAEHLPAPTYQPLLGVLWDMVGDANPVFEQEGHSMQKAPEVVQRVWVTAQRMGHGAVFTNRAGQAITDDHLPLQEKGLRVIDVIDLDYAWHHTTGDTVERVSAKTLGIVGSVALAVLREL